MRKGLGTAHCGGGLQSPGRATQGRDSGPRRRGRSECEFPRNASSGRGLAQGAGLCSPGSWRGLDHEPRQEVPRDAAATTCPAFDLTAAATAGIGGCHLRGDPFRRAQAQSSLQDSRRASPAAGRSPRQCLVPEGPPRETWWGNGGSREAQRPSKELGLDGASVSPTWRPR